MNQIKDELLLELLARITEKDEAAMAEFCRQTQTVLKVYVRWRIRDSGTAEEVVQDIYWHVWSKALDYQRQRGLPWHWLYTIARSRTVDALRSSRRSQAAAISEETASSGEVEETKAWRRLQAQACLEELPLAHRELIRLAYFDGYCHTEIAREAGLPLGTVKSRIRKALTTMREAG